MKNLKGKVLEMGIGEAALNSLYFFKLTGNIVHGIDVSEKRVITSSAVADFNKLNVSFWKSDLFGNVTETYDLVFFNPPYVPTQTGVELNLSNALSLDGDQVWDGGADGMKVIDQFMKEVWKYMSDDGVILLGVQDHYISKERIEKVAIQNNFSVRNMHKEWIVNKFIPTTVYELEKNNSLVKSI